MRRKKTVLVVVAHADDLEFTAAGTVARFVDELGYDVYEYILTDNARGSYRLPPAEVIAVSAQEARRAGEILGLKEVRLEGYTDGDLNEVAPSELRGKVMAMIREVRADIVMSWDPFAPLEDHPDHRAIAMATLDAAAFSGNPRFYPEHAHPPYPVTEAYWFAKSPWRAECYVDITDTLDKKVAALLAHDCQMQLTVDFLRQEAETLGVSLPAFEQMPEGGHAALIDAAMRDHCRRIGATQGLPAAERFRYEKLSALEKMLGLTVVHQDFV
jgi:LmbE family N-acetylglucosaminyl deacetylase